MAPPRYIYQRRGGPLLSWVGGPPRAVRAAETRELGGFAGLGSIDGSSLQTQHVLPLPGAPEYLSSMGCDDRDVDNQGEYIVLARGPLNYRRGKLDIALDLANLALTGGAIYLLIKVLKK